MRRSDVQSAVFAHDEHEADDHQGDADDGEPADEVVRVAQKHEVELLREEHRLEELAACRHEAYAFTITFI